MELNPLKVMSDNQSTYEESTAHRLTKFACYAPLFTARVTPQYVLASETWADWTFLKWVVDLHSNIGLNKLSSITASDLL